MPGMATNSSPASSAPLRSWWRCRLASTAPRSCSTPPGCATPPCRSSFSCVRSRPIRRGATVCRARSGVGRGSGWKARRFSFAVAGGRVEYCVALLTLGLAWPWRVAALERYQLRQQRLWRITGPLRRRGRRSCFKRVFVDVDRDDDPARMPRLPYGRNDGGRARLVAGCLERSAGRRDLRAARRISCL